MTTTTSKPRRGRPHTANPAKTYAGKSYVVTTFRLKKRTVAEADTIAEALALSSRTSAIQYAIEIVFNDLHRLSRSLPRRALDAEMRRRLNRLGG